MRTARTSIGADDADRARWIDGASSRSRLAPPAVREARAACPDDPGAVTGRSSIRTPNARSPRSSAARCPPSIATCSSSTTRGRGMRSKSARTGRSSSAATTARASSPRSIARSSSSDRTSGPTTSCTSRRARSTGSTSPISNASARGCSKRSSAGPSASATSTATTSRSTCSPIGRSTGSAPASSSCRRRKRARSAASCR